MDLRYGVNQNTNVRIPGEEFRDLVGKMRNALSGIDVHLKALERALQEVEETGNPQDGVINGACENIDRLMLAYVERRNAALIMAANHYGAGISSADMELFFAVGLPPFALCTAMGEEFRVPAELQQKLNSRVDAVRQQWDDITEVAENTQLALTIASLAAVGAGIIVNGIRIATVEGGKFVVRKFASEVGKGAVKVAGSVLIGGAVSSGVNAAGDALDLSDQSKAFLEVGVDLASAWIFKRIGQRKGKPLADAQSDSKPRNPFENLQKPENPGVINNRPGKVPNVDLPKDGPPPGFQQKQLPTAKSAPAESPPPVPAVKPTPDTPGKAIDDQRANDKLKSLSDNGEGKPYGTPRAGTTQNNAPPEASRPNTNATETQSTTKLDNGSVDAGNVAPSNTGPARSTTNARGETVFPEGATLKNHAGQDVNIPPNHTMSLRDPAMNAPPILRKGGLGNAQGFTDAERAGFLAGNDGGTLVTPHHRHQIAIKDGGVMDELPRFGHPEGNIHLGGKPTRHPNDGRAGRNGTVFDGPEGEKLHAAEVKQFFVDKGKRLVKDPQTGLWVDPLAK